MATDDDDDDADDDGGDNAFSRSYGMMMMMMATMFFKERQPLGPGPTVGRHGGGNAQSVSGGRRRAFTRGRRRFFCARILGFVLFSEQLDIAVEARDVDFACVEAHDL